MKYICLGYIQDELWASLSADEQQQRMAECLDYDDVLRRGDHFLGGEALETARNAVTLRERSGTLLVTDGPHVETKEVLGGIMLLEARDMNHAVTLMSRHPGVRFGTFEIRPADEQVNALIAARGERFRQGEPQESVGETGSGIDPTRLLGDLPSVPVAGNVAVEKTDGAPNHDAD